MHKSLIWVVANLNYNVGFGYFMRNFTQAFLFSKSDIAVDYMWMLNNILYSLNTCFSSSMNILTGVYLPIYIIRNISLSDFTDFFIFTPTYNCTSKANHFSDKFAGDRI